MNSDKKSFSGKQVCVIAAIAMLLTLAAAAAAVKFWLFPQPFQPVILNKQEEQKLEQKLDQLQSAAAPARSKAAPPPAETDFNQEGMLKPEAYSEQGAAREIAFSEREINSLLASNTDLAQKAAIDFAEDLISLRLLVPLDSDFPILGGKTLRVKAGAEIAFRQGRPVVILKGVSLMGVPLPNAWLGGLKNIDLIKEFGSNPGFWQSFADGVEDIRVREGELHVRLKE